MGLQVDYAWLGAVFGSFSFIFWNSEDFWVIVALLLSIFTYRILNQSPYEDEAPKQGQPQRYVYPTTSVTPARAQETYKPISSASTSISTSSTPTKSSSSVPKEVSATAPSAKEVSDAPSTPTTVEKVASSEKKQEEPVEANEPTSETIESKPVEETQQPTEPKSVEGTQQSSDPADDGAERRLTLEESTAETEVLYKKHRAEADEHAQLRAKYFEDAAEAHKAGDGKLAKELSEKGKEETKLMEEASLRAANAIFEGKNLKQPKGTIDLHGLQVKEAEMIVTREVEKAKSEGLMELKVITGAGHHSDAKGPKVGPAVKKMLEDDGKQWRDDETNASGGAIIVTL